jgi:hypothetical protein
MLVFKMVIVSYNVPDRPGFCYRTRLSAKAFHHRRSFAFRLRINWDVYRFCENLACAVCGLTSIQATIKLV